MTKLSQSEQETLNSYDNDEWISVVSTSNIAGYKSVAANTFKKNKRVNIRISELDLVLIQEKALMEGLPYQTLMSSVLHRYVTGRLKSTS